MDVTERYRAFLRAERERHTSAIERIDGELAGLGDAVLPERTPAAIVAILEASPVDLDAPAIIEALADAGRRVSPEAVATNLSRLTKAGAILKTGHGIYRAKVDATPATGG